MTYLFGEGWAKVADTKQGLLLITWTRLSRQDHANGRTQTNESSPRTIESPECWGSPSIGSCEMSTST